MKADFGTLVLLLLVAGGVLLPVLAATGRIGRWGYFGVLLLLAALARNALVLLYHQIGID